MPICSGGHQELGGEGDQALSHTRRASAPEIPGEVCKGRSSQISNPTAAVPRAERWAQGRRALTSSMRSFLRPARPAPLMSTYYRPGTVPASPSQVRSADTSLSASAMKD